MARSFTLLNNYYLVRKLEQQADIIEPSIGTVVAAPATPIVQVGQLVAYNVSAAKPARTTSAEYHLVRQSDIYAVIN